MTFIAAVAADRRAVDDLRGVLSGRIKNGQVSWVQHNDQAVAWVLHHPWVSSADDGKTLVVLDGQLHNLYEAGTSQAELLLRRYGEMGLDTARGLLGDFVAIVLDRSRDDLLVCRDPVGVRPWYQASVKGRHAGATDVATLCSISWVDTSVNEAEALAYLAGLWESRGPTIHRGITALPPGSTWHAARGLSTVRRHHTWDIEPEPDLAWEEAVERCRAVVEQAVRDRLRVAGSVTSESSGGLDSASIVGTIMKLSPDGLLVGRLVFDGPEADERRFSDAVMAHWGVQGLSVRPWLPMEQEWEEMTRSMRRPPPLPHFQMSRSLYQAFKAEGRSSCLTGQGGDEAFEAMPIDTRVISALQQRDVGSLRQLTAGTLRHPRTAWRRTWRPTLRRVLGRAKNRVPAYISATAAEVSGLAEKVAAPNPRVTGVSAIDERMYVLTSGYRARSLEDAALVADLDRWRTSHPFLDPRVIEATYGLNVWFHAYGGRDRAFQISTFGDRFPDLVRERSDKAHFAEVFWARTSIEDAGRRVREGQVMGRGWLDPSAFNALIEDAKKGRATAALPFFRAVLLDLWLHEAGR